MINFDNHKIEWKFADLFRNVWQSLKKRCKHRKMSLDKIAELYSIWKLLEDSQYSTYNTTELIATSDKVFNQSPSSE